MVTKKTSTTKKTTKKSATKQQTALGMQRTAKASKKATAVDRTQKPVSSISRATTSTSSSKTKTKSVAKTTEPITAKDGEATVAHQLESVQVVDNATKKPRKELIKAFFAKERIITEASDAARELYNSRSFGIVLDDGKVQLSLTEGLYLFEKKRLAILDGRNKPLTLEKFLAKANKVESNFWIRYAVYKDMRNRGYVVKTALKFGADFRVYDRGIKPGEDHARWIVYPVHEAERYTWFDFAAKNRVAHSTKKRLLMGVVDNENDVTYWEIKWVRP